METIKMIDIVSQLKTDEGFRSRVYRDSVGKWTIGYGRNVQDVGITQAEAIYLLNNDIARVKQELSENLYWFDQIHENAQSILIMMTFNMGLAGMMQFKKALEHFKNENYKMAAAEILASKWAGQVGGQGCQICRNTKTNLNSQLYESKII